MRLMLDLNVLLDVLQQRKPHYEASAQLVSAVLRRHAGVVPGHAVTTLYYILRKHAGRDAAEQAVTWMLDRFEVAAPGEADFRAAKAFGLDDFEDAVVCALALRTGCEVVVTRNTSDFDGAPLLAETPTALLNRL